MAARDTVTQKIKGISDLIEREGLSAEELLKNPAANATAPCSIWDSLGAPSIYETYDEVTNHRNPRQRSGLSGGGFGQIQTRMGLMLADVDATELTLS